MLFIQMVSFKSFITKSTVYEGYSVFEHMLLRFIKELKKEDIENFGYVN